MTTAITIIEGINAALSRIRVADGYYTDIGLQPIAFGLDAPDPHQDGPVISVFLPDEDKDRERSNGAHRDLRATVLIAVWLRPTIDLQGAEKATALLYALLDVKRALFHRGQTPEIDPLVLDHSYEGASMTPRPPGGVFAQLVVEGLFKWREDL